MLVGRAKEKVELLSHDAPINKVKACNPVGTCMHYGTYIIFDAQFFFQKEEKL